MSTTIHVKNIGSAVSEKEIKEFFSFCGKISSLSVTPADGTQSASVTFEKESAAKTALLLDNTQLGSNQVHVTSAASLDDIAGSKVAGSADEHEEHIPQEDKPRSRIVAEYLAHGYVISDKAIERAIALDNQHGISTRFMGALQNFDNKYKASEKAQAVDAKYGVSNKAAAGWSGFNSYFEKALGTPTGQRVRGFYQQGNKQVVDVHNEARHLANLKSGKNDIHSVGGDKTQCSCAAEAGNCPCAPGHCACSGCAKNPSDHQQTTSATPESADMKVVSDDGKTKCNCAGATGSCPCPPGKCTCSGCAKATA